MQALIARTKNEPIVFLCPAYIDVAEISGYWMESQRNQDLKKLGKAEQYKHYERLANAKVREMADYICKCMKKIKTEAGCLIAAQHIK